MNTPFESQMSCGLNNLTKATLCLLSQLPIRKILAMTFNSQNSVETQQIVWSRLRKGNYTGSCLIARSNFLPIYSSIVYSGTQHLS